MFSACVLCDILWICWEVCLAFSRSQYRTFQYLCKRMIQTLVCYLRFVYFITVVTWTFCYFDDFKFLRIEFSKQNKLSFLQCNELRLQIPAIDVCIITEYLNKMKTNVFFMLSFKCQPLIQSSHCFWPDSQNKRTNPKAKE